MSPKKIHISVVIPVYGCPEALPELCTRLVNSLTVITPFFEIIMVNDACPKNSWQVINMLSLKDKRLKGLNLSKNFGQHYAITAGLDYANGDWIVVMDCDLQDQPEEIAKLYEKTKEGYDIVVGKRAARKDNFIREYFSKSFSKVFSFFTGIKYDNQTCNYGIYSRKVIRNITRLREQNRNFGLFTIWVGFRRIEINIEHAARKYGKSSYSFKKQICLASDSLISYSNKLLELSVKSGIILACLSFMFGLWIIIRYLFWSITVSGWTSLIVSLYFLSGLILASIGIAGIYIGKIFNEVKGRPLYIVKETTNNLVNTDNISDIKGKK